MESQKRRRIDGAYSGNIVFVWVYGALIPLINFDCIIYKQVYYN